MAEPRDELVRVRSLQERLAALTPAQLERRRAVAARSAAIARGVKQPKSGVFGSVKEPKK